MSTNDEYEKQLKRVINVSNAYLKVMAELGVKAAIVTKTRETHYMMMSNIDLDETADRVFTAINNLMTDEELLRFVAEFKKHDYANGDTKH